MHQTDPCLMFCKNKLYRLLLEVGIKSRTLLFIKKLQHSIVRSGGSSNRQTELEVGAAAIAARVEIGVDRSRGDSTNSAGGGSIAEIYSDGATRDKNIFPEV